jgi:hypothetical protein
MITRTDKLISCCDQEITMREYCSHHQKIIRHGWEELKGWMEARGFDELTNLAPHVVLLFNDLTIDNEK